MEFENFKTLVKSSRCTRRYEKDFEVSASTLEELIDIARVTSSAKNMQPLKYILVTNKDAVHKLAQTAMWATHLTNWNQSEDERPSAFILVLNDTTIDGFAMFDAGVAFEAIMLGANAKGLSACALASINKELCSELFEIPKNHEVMIGISLGKSSEIINLVDVKNNDINYYRNEKDEHCVPKRALEEIVIGRYE